MAEPIIEAEKLLLQVPLLENNVEPLSVNIEHLIKKEVNIDDLIKEDGPAEPDEVAPLFVKLDEIKTEVPDPYLEEPGCSRWVNPSVAGPSFKVEDIPDAACSSSSLSKSQIKSEPPDMGVKEEYTVGEDNSNLSISEGADSMDCIIASSVKSEPGEFGMELDGQLKEEEVMLDDESFKLELAKSGEMKETEECKIIFNEDIGMFKNLFQCTRCSFRTKYKSNLNKHLIVHKPSSEVDWFKCTQCSFKTKRKQSLQVHLTIHKDDADLFQCTKCNYQTKLKYNFTKHIKETHKSVNLIYHYCPFCNFTAKRPADLKQHITIRHANQEDVEMYQCTFCEYKAKTKAYIRKHLVKHRSVEELEIFSCDFCPYQAKRKRNLKVHLLTHKNDDDVDINWTYCTRCDFRTKLSHNLKRHMLLHDRSKEVKKFKCAVCEYRTNRRDSLKLHFKRCHKVSTHTDCQNIELEKKIENYKNEK